MLEVHRYRHVQWKPSPVVSLATSLDGAVVAAARENGAIEIWIVAAGTVGWHCEVTIPGKQDAAISSLVWCISNEKKPSPRGRLFSAGLDGFIAEWDLSTLQSKDVVTANGGSVWQMVSEPLEWLMDGPRKKAKGIIVKNNGLSKTDDKESFEAEDSVDIFRVIREQRVAIGCDDGRVRLYAVSNDKDGMVYKHSFPRVKGRILSVAWSTDAEKIFSGSSDGCIHCWNVGRIQEVYRITVGLGGAAGGGSSLCVWSLLALSDGAIVSGDSSGSTQFWDGNQGTLLQAHTCHGADVLCLAASPSHRSVFAAGADGQVVQYHLVSESRQLVAKDDISGKKMIAGHGDKWVFVGTKRAHTHDVRALAVAIPLDEGKSAETPKKMKPTKRLRMKQQTCKWTQLGVPMLISGGNDAKLFTYAADAFLAFHPYDVCFAPQQTIVKLTRNVKRRNQVLMMAQHQHWIDVWIVPINISDTSRAQLDKEISTEHGLKPLNDRKKSILYCNGDLKDDPRKLQSSFPIRNDNRSFDDKRSTQMGKVKGPSPELSVRIKSKSVGHVSCSALSNSGKLVALSDHSKPRLFEIVQQQSSDTSNDGAWVVRKRKLPGTLPPAHCMAFSADSMRLLLGCPRNTVFVVDVDSAHVMHMFEYDVKQSDATADSPLTKMCTSADCQWLATSNSLGDIRIFNLETFRKHWCVPRLEGSPVTSLLFHSRNSNVLVVGTLANQLHVLDVESRQYSEWSRQNTSRLPQKFREFPGGIQGLSMSPSAKSNSVIVYSQRAMCLIDFQKPVPQEETAKLSAEMDSVPSANGGSDLSEKNFVIVPFKNPVLFLEYLSDTSVLIVEKPWSDVLRELPPPVYRHLYGT